ncbi:hypothetical protein BHE74_00055286, partial [Ensete ventricosum]
CSALPPNKEPAIVVSRCFPIAVTPLPIARPHVAALHPTGRVASTLTGPPFSVVGSDLRPIAPIIHCEPSQQRPPATAQPSLPPVLPSCNTASAIPPAPLLLCVVADFVESSGLHLPARRRPPPL